MIFIRRLLALLLIPVAVLSIFAVPLVLRVNETVLEPQFWVDQLREADVYESTYSNILPAAVAEASSGQTSGAEFDFTRFNADIVRAAREVVPPEWIQQRVEDALLTVPPYLLGEEDTFILTIPVRDRIVAAAEVLKRETKNEAVYMPLYDEGVDWSAEKAVEGAADIEVPIQVTAAEAAGYIRRVIPPDWLQATIDETVDSVLPYLLGEADEFEITIALGERVDSLAGALRDVLGKADTHDLIVEEVVIPTVSENLSGGINVASGVDFSSEQVLDAVRETLTPDWVAEIQAEIIDGVADYLTGRANTLEFAIELGDRKGAVIDSLLPTVEAELASGFDALEECTVEGLIDVTVTGGNLPMCRPPGMDYDEFLSVSDLDSVAELARMIEPLIPNEFLFGESQFREVAGSEAGETLDEVRGWSLDGLKFTHEDVLENLDPEDVARLDDARADVRDGFTLTEQDLEDALADAGIDISTADFGRRLIATARGLAPLAWVQVAFFLLLVGTLGGRNWGSRLGWGFVTLGIGAGLLWAAAVPLYDGFGSTGWDTARDKALTGADSEVTRLAVELGLNFGRAVTDEFISGLANTGLLLLIISGVGLAAAIVLQARRGGRRRTPEAEAAEAPEAPEAPDSAEAGAPEAPEADPIVESP